MPAAKGDAGDVRVVLWCFYVVFLSKTQIQDILEGFTIIQMKFLLKLFQEILSASPISALTKLPRTHDRLPNLAES